MSLIHQNKARSFFASTLIAGMAVAQMPKECFFVTKMQGLEDLEAEQYGDSALLSDLPWLLQYYKPGMRIEKIDGHSTTNDDDEDQFTGLRLHLTDSSKKGLSMSLIGTTQEPDPDSNLKVLKYSHKDQPTSISILTDSFGVCDVILRRANGKEESLSADNTDCMLELDEITQKNYILPKETPLVGFHGITEMEGLDSLGLILFDTKDPECKKPLKESQLGPDLINKSEFILDAYVEENITNREKARADALEAILSYKNLKDARKK